MGFLWQCFDERQHFFLEKRHPATACLYSTQRQSDEIINLDGGYLKVRITAAPIEGKANSHLLKFLAEVFGAGRHQIEITTDKKGQHKQLRIQDPSCLPNGFFQESACC